MPNIPNISSKQRICIICEGLEEELYIKRLTQLNVWNDKYEITPINAKTASNIFPKYQDLYSNDRYCLILAFCDTDKAPHKEYSLTTKKINEYHNNENASDSIIIFANPCTMQIILSHFGDVELKNQGKKTNKDVIEKYTGVKDYDAHRYQIEEICSKIYQRTYVDMKNRVVTINLPYDVSCSTNFIKFLEHFESDDDSWIQEINSSLVDK